MTGYRYRINAQLNTWPVPLTSGLGPIHPCVGVSWTMWHSPPLSPGQTTADAPPHFLKVSRGTVALDSIEENLRLGR